MFKFTSFVMILKIVNSINGNETIAKNFLILKPEKLYKQFVKNLFEFLYNII